MARRNTFLDEIRMVADIVNPYCNPVTLALAESLIPSKLLEMRSKLDDNADMENKKAEELNVLKELITWFKMDFFKWVDTPLCGCDSPNVSFVSINYVPSKIGNMQRIRTEVYQCKNCRSELQFARYNDASVLLNTRKGRCGEWANCFTLMCIALNYEARYVFDKTDHVWTEVFMKHQDRWIHCDPCEGVIDSPLMYEIGWKKKLTYVIAFSTEEVQDVTWRYVANFKDTLSRRDMCSENMLINLVLQLSKERQKNLSKERIDYLMKRRLMELLLFTKPPVVDKSYGSRTSGSLEWRISRKECENMPMSQQMGYVWSPSNADFERNLFEMEYCTVTNEYKKPNLGDTVRTWEKGVYEYQNIFLKIETDWKQSYLCRQEGDKYGTIVWKFECKNKDFSIDTIKVRYDNETFENGYVSFELRCGNKCLQLSTQYHRIETKKFAGCSWFTLTANLKNGSGSEAWQHAQLFRQPLGSTYAPFELKVTFLRNKCPQELESNTPAISIIYNSND